MKRQILSLCFFFVVAAVFAGGKSENNSASVGQKPVEAKVFRVALFNPDSHPMSQAVKKLGEILSQKTNGRLSFEIYYGGQLGTQHVVYQAVQSGAIDISQGPVGVVADYGATKLKVYTLPYLFRSVKQARAAHRSGTGFKMLNHIQESGTRMVGIGFYQESSSRNYFFRNKRVTRLADMKGMKLRTQEGAIYLETNAIFGVNTTSIAFSELYSALQTGIVDGAEQPFSGYYTNRLHEVSKYYLLDGHETAPNVLFMSEIIWNALSEDDHKLLRESFLESSDWYNTESTKKDGEFIEAIKAAGVEIVEPDDPNEWREAVKPIYDKYGAEFKDIIEEFQKLPY
jgi:tripartite ATP-independent transporter DctP family solute receptor